jgi:hypothetical protein
MAPPFKPLPVPVFKSCYASGGIDERKAAFGSDLCLTIVVLLFTSSRLPADSGTCGGGMVTLPFTDVAGNNFFCQIAEAYFSGLTNGTTQTTYSPTDSVTREQMAAFVTRTQDSALRRGSRRAALDQWATPKSVPMTGRTTVGDSPTQVKSDGIDLWVTDSSSGDVKRVRASDGLVIGTWTGATEAFGVLVARGRVYVTGTTVPGHLYMIDPRQPHGVVTTLSSTLGDAPRGITTDGQYIWAANQTGVSRHNLETQFTNNFIAGFNGPYGILFDGASLWITDYSASQLRKLDSNGEVVQNVTVGFGPLLPVFDGSNIWVPNSSSNSVSVVRARDGMVLATLTGNGLSLPIQAAFDGQRVLVTNSSGPSVSMSNASDCRMQAI